MIAGVWNGFESRHVEVSLAQVATNLLEDSLQKLLGFKMADKFRLELCQNRDVVFGWKFILCLARIERAKRLLDQLSRKLAQCIRTGDGRKDEQLPLIEI